MRGEAADTRAARIRQAKAIVIFAVILLALITAGLLAGKRYGDVNTRHWLAVGNLGVDIVVCTLFVFGIGKAVTGFWTGVLLSGRNTYSFSRLQMACWTVVVLAALLTYAKLNLLQLFGAAPPQNALEIDIPSDLLTALGLSTFVTSASPAILALKATQTPTMEAARSGTERQAVASGVDAGMGVTTEGNVVGYTDPQLARWLDVFTGDELADAGTIDLSKVQQALITALLLGSYTFMVGEALFTADPNKALAGLPRLSGRFVELLALSHAGYLVYKAAPKGSSAGNETGVSSASLQVVSLRETAVMPAGPRR